MERSIVSSTLFVLLAICHVTTAYQCTATNTQTFPMIDPANYQTDYADISEGNRRPLGFKKYVVRYTDPAEPVCLSVTGAMGRGIEIMFETDPPAYLCFEDQTGSKKCALGNLYDCDYATSDTMTYDFYYQVSAGSTQSDTNFWLRIAYGMENDADLGWCHQRDSKYPSSLLNQNNLRIPPAPGKEDINSGTGRATYAMVSLFICGAVTLLNIIYRK